MKPRSRKKTFKELELEWCARLKASGFVDIENTSKPDRPLKEWHSTKFMSERSRVRQAQREEYDRKLDEFLNSNAINEICSMVAKHGNSSVRPTTVKKILEFHRDGLAERKIAKKIRKSRDSVHRTLVKAKEWMKVA